MTLRGRSMAGILIAVTWACGSSSVEPRTDADTDADTTTNTDTIAQILRDTLSAMTFNIFHDAATGPARGNIAPWNVRRDLVLETLRAADADVVGLQEALMWQVEWLRLQLPRYEHFGRGGEAGGGGWSVAILYRRDLFALEESGHFWLSSTPDVPGSMGGEGWDATGAPRIASWVRLRFTRTGGQLYVYSAHLPPPEAGDAFRTRSVLLLAERIAARSLPEVPFVILGDLNASEEEFTMRYLQGEAPACPPGACPGPAPVSPIVALDTWRAVHEGEEGTRCRNDAEGRRVTQTFGERVDYVLVADPPSGDEPTVEPAQVLSSSILAVGPSCASDHFPVLSRFVQPGP